MIMKPKCKKINTPMKKLTREKLQKKPNKQEPNYVCLLGICLHFTYSTQEHSLEEIAIKMKMLYAIEEILLPILKKLKN